MSNTLTPDSGSVAFLDPFATSARHLLCPGTLSEVENDNRRAEGLAAILSAILVVCA
jgi:hypothetical protein